MMNNDPTYYDLSHTITDGLITYKGLPAPIICDYWSRETSARSFDDGSSFHIARIELVSNTGTYLDCPFHRYAEGDDLSALHLRQLADLEVVLVDATGTNEVNRSCFEGKELKNKAVLVHTNWDRHWNTETYFEQHPYLTEDAALYLKEQGVKLVGIDSYNIDNTATKSRPVHSILLKANILIVEHLCNMAALPRNTKLSFTAVPPKMEGVGTFPVRAYVKCI